MIKCSSRKTCVINNAIATFGMSHYQHNNGDDVNTSVMMCVFVCECARSINSTTKRDGEKCFFSPILIQFGVGSSDKINKISYIFY